MVFFVAFSDDIYGCSQFTKTKQCQPYSLCFISHTFIKSPHVLPYVRLIAMSGQIRHLLLTNNLYFDLMITWI